MDYNIDTVDHENGWVALRLVRRLRSFRGVQLEITMGMGVETTRLYHCKLPALFGLPMPKIPIPSIERLSPLLFNLAVREVENIWKLNVKKAPGSA
jgi:hypothetical protein